MRYYILKQYQSLIKIDFLAAYKNTDKNKRIQIEFGNKCLIEKFIQCWIGEKDISVSYYYFNQQNYFDKNLNNTSNIILEVFNQFCQIVLSRY